MYLLTIDDPKQLFRPKRIVTVFLAGLLLILAGCGGSTKVYNSNKTIAFRDNIYNVTDVGVYSTKAEAIISDHETINLRKADKKKINALLEQHGSIFVRQTIALDDLVIVYQAKKIESWSEYRKFAKQFKSASEDLQEFLADASEPQLILE